MILALLTCLTSFGQATKRERNLIKQGNEYFNKKQYSKAEESYSRVLEINPNSQIAKYNLGSTMLRQRGGNSEKDVARDSLISRYLSDVGSNTSAPASLRAHSFYNLGKLAYDRQDYANSVNYFKQSLKIDPKDDKARRNCNRTSRIKTRTRKRTKTTRKRSRTNNSRRKNSLNRQKNISNRPIMTNC